MQVFPLSDNSIFIIHNPGPVLKLWKSILLRKKSALAVSEPKTLLHLRTQFGKPASFNQKSSELRQFCKNVVFIESAFQVIASGAAACAYSHANGSLYHTHMTVSPGAHLFVDTQQVVEHLERSLKHRVPPVQHDKQS